MVASRNCVPLPKLPSGATLNLESPGWGANSREWGGKLSTGGRVWPGAAALAGSVVAENGARRRVEWFL